jgi:hypothetical protein
MKAYKRITVVEVRPIAAAFNNSRPQSRSVALAQVQRAPLQQASCVPPMQAAQCKTCSPNLTFEASVHARKQVCPLSGSIVPEGCLLMTPELATFPDRCGAEDATECSLAAGVASSCIDDLVAVAAKSSGLRGSHGPACKRSAFQYVHSYDLRASSVTAKQNCRILACTVGSSLTNDDRVHERAMHVIAHLSDGGLWCRT